MIKKTKEGFYEVEYDNVDKRTLVKKLNETMLANILENINLGLDCTYYWIWIFLKFWNNEELGDKIYNYLIIQLKTHFNSIINERQILCFLRDNIALIDDYDKAMLILNSLDKVTALRVDKYETIFNRHQILLETNVLEDNRYKPEPLTKRPLVFNDTRKERYMKRILSLRRN